MKITPTFTVGMCRRTLISRYKSGVCKVQIKPWEQASKVDVQDIYTVVTMYKIDADGKTLGEQEKVTLEGSVNDIFRTKVNGMLPVRIVVFASAGKGKTTAVAKMAYDWAYCTQGSPLKDIPLLFVLKLRNVPQEASIGQAIKSELLNDIEDLSPQTLETFIRSKQDLCLVILDGLDEYAGNLYPIEGVSKGNISAVLEGRDLPETRVLITSRPHLEDYFTRHDLRITYAKMAIEGFSAATSRKYIRRFFNDETTGRELESYIGQHDVIDELVTTPLFCLLVCYLWRENLLSNIDTQTKLFDSITVFLWRHAQTKSAKYTTEWLKRTLLCLGEVSYRGLLDNSKKLLFSPKDFRRFPEVIDEGCELGLISKTVSHWESPLSVEGATNTTIEFYHKLAQEHRAADYLVNKHENTHILLRALYLSQFDRLFRTKHNQIGEYEHLLRFACGKNNDICLRVMDSILYNKFLPDSERYRILFDCSSESCNLAGAVSSRVGGCIRGGSVVLKSPTIYTAVGMKKLPTAMQQEVSHVYRTCVRIFALV